MDHWAAPLLPAPIHEVDYEQTVDDVEGVARRFVAACGLNWEPRLPRVPPNRAARQDSQLRPVVRQPVYKKVRRPLEEVRIRELSDLFSCRFRSSHPGTESATDRLDRRQWAYSCRDLGVKALL